MAPRSPTRKGKSRRTPSADRADPLIWAYLATFVAVAAWYALRSQGAYHDDDLDHYYMARAAFKQPDFFLNPWGRPAFTMLYALPAQLGFTVVRLTTVLITAAAAWVTGLAARRSASGPAATAVGLTLWQPLFFYLSFSSLVEPLAALLLAVILHAMVSSRVHRAGIVAGLLPLARLELIVVTLFVGVWLGVRRDWKPLVWLVVPLGAWAVVGAVAHGDPLWLARVIGGSGRPLRSAGPIHYVRNYITVVGPTAFLGLFLAALTLFRRSGREAPGPRLAGGIWVLVFVTLTALTWEKLPFGGSIGFLRHLIVLAPAVGILALAGYESLFTGSSRPRQMPLLAIALLVPALVALFLSHRLMADFLILTGHDWSRLIGVAPAAALVLAAALVPGLRPGPRTRRASGIFLVLAAAAFCLATLKPIPLTIEQQTVKAGVDYLVKEGCTNRFILANHPWFYKLTGRDRWDRRATPYVTRANVEAAPPGSMVFWENHYGARLYGDVPLEELQADARFNVVFAAQSSDEKFGVLIFEKTQEH